MRVLAIGNSGQLVRALAERAREYEDIQFTAVGRPELDLATPGSVSKSIARYRPDVVVNTAAYTAVDAAEDDVERAFAINERGAEKLARSAAEVDAKFIQISTDYVFDGRQSEPYDETAETGPVSVYGRSKLAGEIAVRSAAPKHAIIRTAWVFSPFGSNFLKSIIKAAAVRDELTVVDDQRGSPTSAHDLADAVLAMAISESGWAETYHVAGKGSASWYDFAVEIMRVAGRVGLPQAEVRPIETKDWPTRACRPQNSILSCTKFESRIGFAMRHWKQATAEVVARIAADSPV